jgi:hypothetical protein
MYQTIDKFHKARRMFAVINGTVLIAPAGLAESHAEWLGTLCGRDRADRYLDHYVRGYVLGLELRAYVGRDFSPNVNAEDVYLAFRAMSEVVPIQWVAFGAVPENGTVVWPAAVPAVSVWKWAGEKMPKVARL